MPQRMQTTDTGSINSLTISTHYSSPKITYKTEKDHSFSVQKVDANRALFFYETKGIASHQPFCQTSLRRLSLSYSQLNDARFALLPFGTLKEFSLSGLNTLTSLEPLRGSQLRVFDLANQENLGDTLAQVIFSMSKLEELDLFECRLTDAQAESLLQLEPKLHKFGLHSSDFRMSPQMRQRLKEVFGDKLRHFSSFLSP